MLRVPHGMNASLTSAPDPGDGTISQRFWRTSGEPAAGFRSGGRTNGVGEPCHACERLGQWPGRRKPDYRGIALQSRAARGAARGT